MDQFIIAVMAKKKSPFTAQPLYLSEWLDHLDLSDQEVATKLNTDRTTVFRWRTDQKRLDPGKMIALANVMGIDPRQLFDEPGAVSLDAIAKGAPKNVRETAADIVRRLVKPH